MPAPGGRVSRWGAALSLLAGIGIIPLAPVIAPAFHDQLRDFPLRSFFAAVTQFPSTTTILVLVAVIWQLDPKKRAAIPFLIVTFLCSGLITEPTKQLLGRARPEVSVVQDVDDYPRRLPQVRASFPRFADPGFGPGADWWLLPTAGRPWFDDMFASFPSGHATSAFILAAFLSALYPKCRWLWIFLAAGCALARVRTGRHFLDDVLVGAGLGWLLATWVFRWQWLSRLASRLAER